MYRPEGDLKRVQFAPILYKITHWQSLVSQNIQLSPEMTFHLLYIQAHSIFSDEIGGNKFRFYVLPRNFADINQRILLNTDNKLLQFLDDLLTEGNQSSLLYVWNEETPTKLNIAK